MNKKILVLIILFGSLAVLIDFSRRNQPSMVLPPDETEVIAPRREADVPSDPPPAEIDPFEKVIPSSSRNDETPEVHPVEPQAFLYRQDILHDETDFFQVEPFFVRRG